jgi:hypothetical protein
VKELKRREPARATWKRENSFAQKHISLPTKKAKLKMSVYVLFPRLSAHVTVRP